MYPISMTSTLTLVVLLVTSTLLVRYTILEPAQDTPVDAPAEPPVEISLVLTEYSVTPREIQVPAHRRIRLTVENAGAEAHEMEIEGLSFELTNIQPGDVVTVLFDAPEPGRHEIACHYPGHYEGGMQGWLVVTDTRAP